MSPVGAKDSFAPTGLMYFLNFDHDLQPWLHSFAAPRLSSGS